MRNVEVKIFKAKLTFGSTEKIYYFINRMELFYIGGNEVGNKSAYQKMKSL